MFPGLDAVLSHFGHFLEASSQEWSADEDLWRWLGLLSFAGRAIRDIINDLTAVRGTVFFSFGCFPNSSNIIRAKLINRTKLLILIIHLEGTDFKCFGF